MKKLYAEVNEMKAFMHSLKQGGVIGEMFEPKTSSQEQHRAERLE